MGFDLIAANNGWAMAFTGAIIVMIGLAGLALVISQLHKIISLFESKKSPQGKASEPTELSKAEQPLDWVCDPEGASRVCQICTASSGDSFKLIVLHKELQRMSCPNPHLTIRMLRESGLLLPAEQGLFCWKQSD